MSLLRPVAWIEQYGLEPSKQFTLVLSEIEVDGRATLTAIGPYPPIAAGDGQVVIGRFKTHQVSNLVEVTLTSGTRFVGTNTHPVWLPEQEDWFTLKDLQPQDSSPAIYRTVNSTKSSRGGAPVARPAKIPGAATLEWSCPSYTPKSLNQNRFTRRYARLFSGISSPG